MYQKNENVAEKRSSTRVLLYTCMLYNILINKSRKEHHMKYNDTFEQEFGYS